MHEDYVHDCSVCHPGDPRQVSPPTLDDINIITEEGEEEEKEEDEDTLRYLCDMVIFSPPIYLEWINTRRTDKEGICW